MIGIKADKLFVYRNADISIEFFCSTLIIFCNYIYPGTPSAVNLRVQAEKSFIYLHIQYIYEKYVVKRSVQFQRAVNRAEIKIKSMFFVIYWRK